MLQKPGKAVAIFGQLGLQPDLTFSFIYCSLRRQVAAVDKLTARGMFFWDYGNAFLLEASRAGNYKSLQILYMYM